MTLVSVIIPTFNKSPLITDIVRSFRNQTFKDFELIIVDDGSSDDTVRSIKMLRREERHLKIKVLETGLTDQFGMCKAINMGLRETSGRLTVLFNDDIYPLDSCLAQHVQAQEETGYRHVFIGPRFFNPPHLLGQLVVDENTHRQLRRKYTTGTCLDGYLTYRGKMMVSSNVSIATDTLCKIGGYNESFVWYSGAIDRDLYARLCNGKINVLYLPDAQAFAVRYGHQLYSKTKWVRDNQFRGGLSVVEWKQSQTRRTHSRRIDKQAKWQSPPAIKRRKK